MPTPLVLFAELVARVLDGDGRATREMRRAAASEADDGLPLEARPVIAKIRRHAYKVTDEDVAALRAAGLSEDQIYELTIAASIGVAERRLARAKEVLDAAG